jgi:CHAT domain-containing protein
MVSGLDSPRAGGGMSTGILAQWLAGVFLAYGCVLSCPANGETTAPSLTFNNTYAPELRRLQLAQDWTRLEALARQALGAMETQFGADSAPAGAAAGWLAMALASQRRYPEAEAIARHSLAVNEKVYGPNGLNTGISLDTLATILRNQGHLSESEPLERRALGIIETISGPEDPAITHYLDGLADELQRVGRYSEAETLRRRSLAIVEKKFGPESAMAAQGMDNLAGLFLTQRRLEEAEPLFRHSLAIREKLAGPDHPDTATNLNNLATLLFAAGKNAEAETLDRRVLAIFEKSAGPQDFYTAAALGNLASAVSAQGRFPEAEALLRRALAIVDTPARRNLPDTAQKLNNLADILISEDRYADAERLLQRALVIFQGTLGPDNAKTLAVHSNLANTQALQGKWDAATANLRIDCTTSSSQGGSPAQNGAPAARAQKSYTGKCWTRLSLALWAWAARGGGASASDHPDSLKFEAFAASQRALQSAAGEAMARSAALVVADAAGVGTEARAYEAALLERDTLALTYARVAGESGADNLARSQALAESRSMSLAHIDQLEAQIKAKAPLYWDYRSPTPLSATALQSKTGADASLLRTDEALLTVLVAEGRDKGLMFALTKDHLAWAQLGLTGDEIKVRVNQLRSQIDPDAYGLGDIGVNPGPFNRQAAFELHQALLGDDAIQKVIKDKSVLLFVPSGPLTSLPPALLITAPPTGGADTDPETLRATSWLLRRYAVGLLPAVSSLRTLREGASADRPHASDPLLAFADPDFVRRRAAGKPGTKRGQRGFAGYFRDGVPLAEALDELPQLPGTRIEGEALMRALQGRPGSLLLGRDASKAELMRRNKDGRLEQVRVLEFATHGLVAGDASDLAEPALALAVGDKPEDELLLASEAATLRLNADWVVLSACNTASPDAPTAEGLSGLSRAFFYAGAKSLLVSHWRVRDDVAPLLIPAMLLAGRERPNLSRAQALREASLAILDNRTLNAADPAAWAPFTLIGEPGP